MSYEGFVQKVCINGHYNVSDDSNGCYGVKDPCVECGSKKFPWTNYVDDTNCYCDGEIKTVDLRPYIKEPAKYKVCILGHKHQISPDIYDVQAMVRDENKIRLLRTTA